jgi:hypothetical protein
MKLHFTPRAAQDLASIAAYYRVHIVIVGGLISSSCCHKELTKARILESRPTRQAKRRTPS